MGVQAQVDGGQRQGPTTPELAEIRELKTKVRRLEEDNENLRRASIFFAEELDPQPLIVAFVNEMRAQSHAVESVCRVLREQGCQVAARTYRAWSQPQRVPADRVVSDAVVEGRVRGLAWTVDEHGCRRLTPEGLYGRRKMTALVRRQLPGASPGSIDRAMTSLSLQGIRRSKGIRTTIRAKDGKRAGDLLDRNFTAAAPNRTWVMDFTYCRTWVGFVYGAFIVDVFAQKIVAWHAATVRDADLVLTPLKMAIWQRGREGHPIEPGELIGHSDAGRQGGFNRSSQHLDHGGERWDVVSGQRWGCPQVFEGSGRRIGRCDRRCGHRVGLSRHARCNAGFGD